MPIYVHAVSVITAVDAEIVSALSKEENISVASHLETKGVRMKICGGFRETLLSYSATVDVQPPSEFDTDNL